MTVYADRGDRGAIMATETSLDLASHMRGQIRFTPHPGEFGPGELGRNSAQQEVRPLEREPRLAEQEDPAS